MRQPWVISVVRNGVTVKQDLSVREVRALRAWRRLRNLPEWQGAVLIPPDRVSAHRAKTRAAQEARRMTPIDVLAVAALSPPSRRLAAVEQV